MADATLDVPKPAAFHAATSTPKPAASGPVPAPAPAGSRRREAFIGFVKDAASATLLHETLEPRFADSNRFQVMDFRAALKILGGMETPEVVLIDLTGEEQPLNAIMDLAEVVDEGTVVLAVGEIRNVNFYRTVTRGMGVREYLPKPLTREAIERNFLSLLTSDTAEAAARGGRVVAIAGTRGGIGTSTIATNLAWLIGEVMHRHTVLLDADLYGGTAALALNVKHSAGLCTALEAPERIDQLLIERATQAAGERLHVLAAVEPLTRAISYEQRAAGALTVALRARYNFVVADVGARLGAFASDLLHLAHQRVIVADPSQISLRSLERLLRIPAGPMQSPRIVLVLNQAGRAGGLSQAYVEQAVGQRFDVVVPDMPKDLPKATLLGQPAAAKGKMREAMQALAVAIGAVPAAEPRGRKAFKAA